MKILRQGVFGIDQQQFPGVLIGGLRRRIGTPGRCDGLLNTEECVNDTYLSVWNSVPPQQPNPLMTYVCSITRNLALKKYHASAAVKRNSYYDVALEELETCLSVPDTAETAFSAKELAELLNRFLGALDRENRVIFLRRYWYADSVSAIAIRLRMSDNQVSVRLHRIRKKLKAYLRKEGVPV